ncbi:MAG: polyphenol oxidase family protein, partial [Actinobacteria bacterium]|nr:polyphenol oxidase family protein [Actinomycetota bacterium]
KIEKIERENTIIFTSLELREKHKILVFFTSRKGGYSRGKYDSLNLGYHVEDDPENVRKNRDKLLNLFSLGNATGLFSPNQIHGDKIFDINDKFVEENHGLTGITPYFSTQDSSKISADGLITSISTVPLMVMAADCNLILMADIKKRVVAAVHAGWKGVLKKIELNAINEETLNLFMGTYKSNLPAKKVKNSPDSTNYYFIDLVKIIKNNLINSGIPKNNISDSGLCTFCNNENLFFSYRKEKKTGRHAGIIMLE